MFHKIERRSTFLSSRFWSLIYPASACKKMFIFYSTLAEIKHEGPQISRKSPKNQILSNDRLFVIEGKNDFLIIGLVLLLLAFFPFGRFFFR